jgi:uncharacterized membrane protein
MGHVAGQVTPQHLKRLLFVLILSNGLSVLLFLIRVVGSDGFRYWYMLWNLFLAWLPLLFAALLVPRLKRRRWLNWGNVVLVLLWLGFLPNSFYVLTDLIHLQSTGEINILFDAVLLFSFIFNGYVSGFLSVYMIHRALQRRLLPVDTHLIITGVFLLCGLAIYLGRALRWNTWDVLINPAGLLFDVSEGVFDPFSHPQLFVTTLTFFALLSVIYAVVYQFVEAVRASE